MARTERLVTPAGIARYAWLKDPDTKFNPAGVWRTQLLVPADKCTEIMSRLDELAEEEYEAACRKAGPVKKKNIKKHPPYTPDLDDNGVETGFIVLRFKKNTAFVGRNGETVHATLPAFDSKLKPILEVPYVYSGSKLKVNFSPLGYYVDAHKAAGVGLWMNSIQIINLVSGARDAASYGYSVEEDGEYIYQEASEAPSNSEKKLREEIHSMCGVIGAVESKTPAEVLSELTGGIADLNLVPFSVKTGSKTVSPLTEVWEKVKEHFDGLKDPATAEATE